eukprot:TRINITY_DN64011_c0_g1_i1.p1 TRINITY_DN64011_c0_g1~~TRINITY_DN64011_c0_g1_i1.p1  ORF type:complete len:415 (+),score=74.23 TRINITY_DN64011_c0_g1_i1:78-1322(+)
MREPGNGPQPRVPRAHRSLYDASVTPGLLATPPPPPRTTVSNFRDELDWPLMSPIPCHGEESSQSSADWPRGVDAFGSFADQLRKSPSAASTATPPEAEPCSTNAGPPWSYQGSSIHLRSPPATPASAKALPSARSPVKVPNSSRLSRLNTCKSRAGRECLEAQAKFEKATAWAAKQIGPGHPQVEAAKKEVTRLRNLQSHICWKSSERWHEANLDEALQHLAAGHGDCFIEDALHQAQLELGPRNRVVVEAQAALLRLRKELAVGALREAEVNHSRDMLKALDSGCLQAMEDSIQAGAKALGPAHVAVEAARQEYLEHRYDLQCQQWDECVAFHHELMVEACQANDPELIEARIIASIHSPLGQSHPVVQYGKKYLLWLRRAMQRLAEEQKKLLLRRANLQISFRSRAFNATP